MPMVLYGFHRVGGLMPDHLVGGWLADGGFNDAIIVGVLEMLGEGAGDTFQGGGITDAVIGDAMPLHRNATEVHRAWAGLAVITGDRTSGRSIAIVPAWANPRPAQLRALAVEPTP